MKKKTDGWKLSDWVAGFERSEKEIQIRKDYLRRNYYPVPEDCPASECKEWRPACGITCKIAMSLCGDW